MSSGKTEIRFFATANKNKKEAMNPKASKFVTVEQDSLIGFTV